MASPVPRLAARVLLLDDVGRVLLFRGGDPSAPERGTWWFTPGGGLDPGESRKQGAARELFEETGLRVHPESLGEPVLRRSVQFEFAGHCFDQDEEFFLVRGGPFEVDTAGFTELELASVVEHRWWTRADLAATAEKIFPDGLVALLERVG